MTAHVDLVFSGGRAFCADAGHAFVDAVAVRAVTLRGPACIYDLVGVAPPDRVATLVPDFERFSASFALTGVAP